MGIRYYAYPIVEADVDAARTDPHRFLGADPLMDAWGPRDDGPDMLYLDKCWRDLQVLLTTPPDRPRRPAASLVAGSVIETSKGWIPHCGVLTPDEVAEVATDLAQVSKADIFGMLTGRRKSAVHTDHFGFIAHFLEAAQNVTARWAASGFGLVYMIG